MPVGDTAVSVQFEPEISQEVNRQVTDLASRLAEQNIKGIVEFVPTYAALMIYYDPLQISYQAIVEILHSLEQTEACRQETQRTVFFPALYGGEHGPDLEDVARYHQLTSEEVIYLHSSAEYRVYMLGFSPGFPYLGGLPQQICTPRLETPRRSIPAGSIGIAGAQTGVYSISSPGGWRIIAHTPVPLFQLSDEEQPFLLRAGDTVKFLPVSLADYQEICEQIKNKTYSPQMVERKYS
jgi:inhibitor of KinA